MNSINGSVSKTENLKGSISGTQTLNGGSAVNIAVTPDIKIGTVTTLEPDAAVIVELDKSSTKMNPVFNFGIPRGKPGEKGDAGSVKFIIVNELPTENIDDNAIYMMPAGATTGGNAYEEYIFVNGAWESLGSASVNVDLADYVKFTDIASGDKAGVVKLKGAEGIWLNGDKLTINEATETRIDSRTPKFPITPGNLDYAIKSGLSNNTLEWTNEEKESARDLLGVGVAKTGTVGLVTGTTTYAVSINGSGGITCNKLTYDEYKIKTENAFVSVGTLRNVINETLGDIETLLGGI